MSSSTHSQGFGRPSSIQKRVIAPFCEGLDVILQDPSGTGMLETFCIGILKKLDYGLVHCQALVLAPTTELVLQIKEVMQDLGRFHGVRIHACVGGTSVPKEDRQRFLKVGYNSYIVEGTSNVYDIIDMDGQFIFKGGVHVIVGTPGCVYDVLQRGRTRLDCIKMFVMDEVDQMLSLGFKDKIDEIFKLLPCEIQVGVTSATMPTEALEITRKFMKKPVTIQAKPDELTLEGIRQFYVDVEKEEWKLETLCDIFQLTVKAKSIITHCIVFVDTRCKVDWLMDKMQSRDHKVSVIQSDMDQNTRDIIVREFFSQSGSPHVLITTDPLVCGTDLHKVSLIVNYDLPDAPENYLYRIGRSGQFGRCVAINFMTKDEATMIIDIQKFYDMVIEELPYNFDDLL